MDQQLQDRLERIRRGLARLRDLDPLQPGKSHFVKDGVRLDGREMFGAESHDYESRPMSEDDLVEIETKMGCALPEEFRAFLAEIGAGASPAYGIREQTLLFCAREECARPFPEGESGEIYTEIDEHTSEELKDGFLTIIHAGCADYYLLVTAGPSRGNVVKAGFDGDAWFMIGPFLDFYEDWIDRGITALTSDPRPRHIS